MAAALRNAHRHAGIPLEAALKMATATPAAALGTSGKVGTLQSGAHADLVLLDAALQTSAVWVGGRRAV
jgi:N-acetylglucosamine-6-phosphate deacetylase